MTVTFRKKCFQKYCLIWFAFCFFIPTNINAVMPPEHYDRLVRESRIKAVAIVKKIIVLSKTDQRTHKKIVFDLETGFEENMPSSFEGTCYSIDHTWQKPMVGGTIYYYPFVGQKVLVTITSNSGKITSYTPLGPDLLKEIKKNGLANISYGMGKAMIVEENEK